MYIYGEGLREGGEIGSYSVGMENPKCVGQTSRQEIQITVDVAVLSLNSTW